LFHNLSTVSKSQRLAGFCRVSLNEVGEIMVSGYTVPIVIKKIDGAQAVQTMQGKKYIHQKKLKNDQNDLFNQ
jgi:hypothetical protein